VNITNEVHEMTTDTKDEKDPETGCWAPGALFPGLQLRIIYPGVRSLMRMALGDLVLLLLAAPEEIGARSATSSPDLTSTT
jgi:hypothetical protein